MDINNINGSLNNELSTLSGSVNLNSLDRTREIVNDGNGTSFNLDIDTTPKRSDLSTTLRGYTQQISQAQLNISVFDQQTDILNNIQNMTNSIVSSDQPASVADQLQPEIQNSINNYNALSDTVDTEMIEGDLASRAYFDGKVGAKPLSPSEILQAVEEQMSIINEQKQASTQQMEQVQNQAMKSINSEIEKSAAASPFKSIDFGQDIGNFSSANINNVLGSVAVSQANAIPANSPRLLA